MRAVRVIVALMSLHLGACVSTSPPQNAAAGALAAHPPPVIRVSARVDPPNRPTRGFRSKFRVDEDAFVLVGLIDHNGRLRILFPDYPDSIGLVRADTTYMTHEVYVAEEWRMPPLWFHFRRYDVARDSYDPRTMNGMQINANTPFLFAISSRYPLELSLLDSGTGWIGVQLDDEVYYNDPRAAVFDLARTIGVHGPNTVTFASLRSERQASDW